MSIAGSNHGLEERLRSILDPASPPAGLQRRICAAAPRITGGRAGRGLGDLRFAIGASDRGIVSLKPGRPGRPAGGTAGRLAERAREELAEYLEGRRAFFTVPIDTAGLPEFQRRVLETAATIRFGEARPYAWIAARVGHPRAMRAVGTALARNPVPFLVPCHRVLRGDGGLGGYAFGLPLKRQLLDLEARTPLWVGCSSTRIVCRVGCSAAGRMRPDRRVVFASVEDARSLGYRTCRTCRSGWRDAGALIFTRRQERP